MATIINSMQAATVDRTVTARYFGTGNGARLVWNLAGVDAERALLSPNIYRSDWAGNQRLYATQRTNMILYSEQFDNAAWLKLQQGVAPVPVVTANYGTAPDGTSTADRVQMDLGGGTTSTDRCRLEQTMTVSAAGFYTFSVWLKVNSGPNVVMHIGNYNTPAQITVTSEWRRFDFSINWPTLSSSVYFRIIGGGSTSTSADLSIWGAQFESGSAATAYIPTTSAAVSVTDYAVDAAGKVTFAAAPVAGAVLSYLDPWLGTAAFKTFGVGDGTSTQFSLPWAPTAELIYRSDWAGNQRLYATQRTNNIKQSQSFNVASWAGAFSGTGTTPVVTADYAEAPDGTMTAERVQFDRGAGTTGTDYSYYLQGGLSLPTPNTISFWARSTDGVSSFVLRAENGSNSSGANITISGVWQRFSIPTTGSFGSLYFQTRGNLPTSQTLDILLWGVQVESGSVATAYIPTTSAAVSVTDYAVDAAGKVTFAAAPVADANLTFTGNFGPTR